MKSKGKAKITKEVEEAETEEVQMEVEGELPKEGKPDTPKKQTSKDSKGSKASKGSVGSTGSASKANTKPTTKIERKPETKPTTSIQQKPKVPITKPVPMPVQRTQVSNAQVAQQQAQMPSLSNAQMAQQIQQVQQPPVHMYQRMNRAPRQTPITIEQPAVFNDDQQLLPVAVKEKAKESKPYDLQTNLEMQIKARQNVIKLSSKEPQLLPVMINIKTKQMEENSSDERSPIDLVCVIDISGSMSGEKIALVRNTLMSLLEMVSEHDRISLIQFDDRAERLTPLLRNTKENQPRFELMINQLTDRGGTNIAIGMDLAFKVLHERKYSNPVTSIFLLTDGLDGGAHQRVSARLVERKLLETNFTINCFGFGRDHDEDLLNNISKLKDGSFYFIDKLDTVDECFASALGGLMSVVALDINLYVTNTSFKPFESIMIKKTFGDMWVQKGVTSGYHIALAQLLAGTEKGFMLEMQIPALAITVSDKERNVCVLEADFSAKDKQGKNLIKKNAKLTLQLINENEQIGEIDEDGEVLENYFRVKGAEAILEAVNLANVGKYDQGSKKLEYVIDQIAKSKKVDQKKIQSVVEQLVDSKESCKPRVYEAVGKKCMVSNQKCFIEQKACSSQMYSNKMQTELVNQVKSKKMSQKP